MKTPAAAGKENVRRAERRINGIVSGSVECILPKRFVIRSISAFVRAPGLRLHRANAEASLYNRKSRQGYRKK